MKNFMGLLAMTLFIAGCVSPLPVREYTMARAAVEAARESGAGRLAPGIWHKADEYYRTGQAALRDQDNDAARAAFRLAQKYAERAENAARLKRFESGEAVP